MLQQSQKVHNPIVHTKEAKHRNTSDIQHFESNPQREHTVQTQQSSDTTETTGTATSYQTVVEKQRRQKKQCIEIQIKIKGHRKQKH